MARLPATPGELAAQLGVPPIQVRAVLRREFPGDAPGSGRQWALNAEHVAVVERAFARMPPAPRSPAQAALATEAWDWEGNVQAHLVAHLRTSGWEITSVADTERRERGHDVVAAKGRRRLVVEVKGYPSTGYRDPRRSGEIKRTNPELQAKHWFADVLLHVLRTKGLLRGVEVAICLPEAKRYATILSEVRASLEVLGVGVYFVPRDGAVRLEVEHR